MSDKEEKKILTKFADALAKKIAKAIPSATGETAKSIRPEISNTGFIIFGGEQIEFIIDGRGPTKAGAKAGKPTLQQMIFTWIKARSIRPKESSMSKLSLSWAMSKSIHKKGYKGKGNIFKNILAPKKFASLISALSEHNAITLQSDISKQLKVSLK